MFKLDNNKISAGLGVLLVISLVTISQLYSQVNALKNPDKAAQNEVATVVSAVSKLMLLPTDEQVTIATVADPTKLKDQTFFANSKIGDKVLIYQANRKAILYNPTLNKIIEVSPINIGAAPTAPVKSTETATQAKKK